MSDPTWKPLNSPLFLADFFFLIGKRKILLNNKIRGDSLKEGESSQTTKDGIERDTERTTGSSQEGARNKK